MKQKVWVFNGREGVGKGFYNDMVGKGFFDTHGFMCHNILVIDVVSLLSLKYPYGCLGSLSIMVSFN